MSGPAQVRSVEAIEAFGGALARFEQRAQGSLETLTSEVRRASDWLQMDRPGFWKEQIRLASEAVHEAKVNLDRCLMYPVADERPSCREERDALKQAQQRLDYCREKAERVVHWKRQLHHEMFEFEGRLAAMREILEAELPQARASLTQIIRRLDEYRVERPPESIDSELQSTTNQNKASVTRENPGSQASTTEEEN